MGPPKQVTPSHEKHFSTSSAEPRGCSAAAKVFVTPMDSFIACKLQARMGGTSSSARSGSRSLWRGDWATCTLNCIHLMAYLDVGYVVPFKFSPFICW